MIGKVFEFADITGRNPDGSLQFAYYCEDEDCPIRKGYKATFKRNIPVKHRGHTPMNPDGSIAWEKSIEVS